MIKPDGVQRRLIGDIISRFESKGFMLRAMKLTKPSTDQLEEHYRDLKAKSFFPKLVRFMSSGPVVAMVSDALQSSICNGLVFNNHLVNNKTGLGREKCRTDVSIHARDDESNGIRSGHHQR